VTSTQQRDVWDDDDATEDDDDVPTMRTSMTVGGAGATTERELGELKVRLRPRRRSMGSVARRRYRATVRKDDDENDATVRTRTDEFNGLTNGSMCT